VHLLPNDLAVPRILRVTLITSGDSPILVPIHESRRCPSNVGAGADDEQDDEEERLEVE
jgi:virulence-associated protein VagC